MSITLKLRKRASEKAKAELAQTLKTLKVKPEPLFPGNSAQDLATMYSLEVGARRASAVLQSLTGLKAVEFVELQPKRQLF